jgi:NTE family protein
MSSAEWMFSRPGQPRIGLALGGGVARGWAHIGVLRALLDAGIEPDMVAGTSIGALVGACYLAGKLDSVEDWARSVNRFKAVSYLDFTMSRAGLISGERLSKEMRAHFGDMTIEHLPKPFVCIASDLTSGREVWLTRGSVVEAVRASYSLPGVFPPMALDGRWLVDGALVNPLPVSVCVAMGARIVIGVNVNADISRRIAAGIGPLQSEATFDVDDVVRQAEKSTGTGRGLGRLAALPGLVRVLLRRDRQGPSVFGVMVSSLSLVLDRATRARLASDPPDVHITPRVGHIGLAEFDRAEELIALGRAAGDSAVGELKDILAHADAGLTPRR